MPKILIVEDEIGYAVELERMVEELGYEILNSVDNGQAVINQMNIEKPDLILMDISIKGNLSGIDTAAEIRNHNIPIIFLTAHNDGENFKKAKAAGMEAYLIKPFNKFTLQSVIETALEKKKSYSNPGTVSPKIENGAIMSDSIFIKNVGKLNRVKFTDILYIHAEGNYIDIVTDSKKYAMKKSLRRIKDKMPSQIFIQVHRNYLINLEYVESIDVSGGSIKIGNHQLPIGGKYKDGLLDRLNQL